MSLCRRVTNVAANAEAAGTFDNRGECILIRWSPLERGGCVTLLCAVFSQDFRGRGEEAAVRGSYDEGDGTFRFGIGIPVPSNEGPSCRRVCGAQAQKNEMDDRAIQSELLAEALVGTGEKLACPSCEKDYWTACPEGWSQTQHGACMAPVGYMKCEAMAFLNTYLEADKRDFESRCDVCWPCKGGGAFMARRVGLHQKAMDLPLDLPKELVLDVNKAPYPVVNIIADQSVGSPRALGALMRQRKAEKAMKAEFRGKLERQEASFREVIGKQEAQLQVQFS